MQDPSDKLDLVGHLPSLSNKRIVLASASPRRKELLSALGLKFEIITSKFEETLPHSAFPTAAQYAVETARQKALDVARVVTAQPGAPVDLIISADTVVEHKDKILEKPEDADHARDMLHGLSGSSHHVHTGVALVLPQHPPDPTRPGTQAGDGCWTHTFACTTNVNFDDLPDGLIEAYIASGEPFDKAGGYGIQGLASSFVKSIDGCYFNVVGFPVHRFTKELLALIQGGHLPV